MRKETAEDFAEAMQNLSDTASNKLGYNTGFVFTVIEESGDFGILLSCNGVQDDPLFNLEELVIYLTLQGI
jgi:hypothetical protein